MKRTDSRDLGQRGEAKTYALVLSGGIGLGAYQCGAIERLQTAGRIEWIAGSSVGAVNAALIVGSKAEDRITAMKAFWEPNDVWKSPLSLAGQKASNWLSALGARMFGVAGQFTPSWLEGNWETGGLYDLRPMRRRLKELIDFERLNSGETRLSVATTDIETGESVIFDTGKGDRIEIDHLMASCGFLPEFAPVEINGRLLADGGLSANAPIEPVLEEDQHGRVVIVVDLFARDGLRPKNLRSAIARKNDLIFSNQTVMRIEAYQGRVRQSRGAQGHIVCYLSYRPQAQEADAERMFDFSGESLSRRWEAGAADMDHGLSVLSKNQTSKSPEEVLFVRR